MTPAAFKAARKALGLSQNALARALRVADGRTVRRWEAGERDIPGPAQVAVLYMLRHGPLETREGETKGGDEDV